MNEILQLKGAFRQKDANKPGPSTLPTGKHVEIKHLKRLKQDILSVREFWKKETLSINPLISVYYKDVVAKSNRIKGLLENGSKKSNKSIVGAKFTKNGAKKHIITHCVSHKTFEDAIHNIDATIAIIRDNFGDRITYDDIRDINNKKFDHLFSQRDGVSKTRFIHGVIDAYYVEKFGVEKDDSILEENAIITVYNTGTKTSDIMRQLGINVLDIRIMDETTVLLTPEQYGLLKAKAPYLISMAVSDIALLENEDLREGDDLGISIPRPNNEPTIGVIDTMFDESVYFSEWVEFKNMLSDDIPLTSQDFKHGTMVSSIIVDGPSINKDLDDGCGRFRVRHFGVATSGRFSSFTVLRAIKEIVTSNRDIKVWNLSLGSLMEINDNFISPEAAILDKLQYENDVLFVVAGTNKPKGRKIRKIGAPADSINSIVVNSVGLDNKPTEYSREGLVLSFFNKPDVSYYGGDNINRMRVCTPLGEDFVTGTSFAAPWIARKVAYLIEVLGLTRELAKALIIDAATGWNDKECSPQLIGYGVVPIRIDDIVKTPDDEIKFMINGISEKFDTYNYNIPVPVVSDKQPFVSKATLCYFPNCSRNQGVDYTNTEMDIHFGRLTESDKGRKISIKCINDNKQSNEGQLLLYEGSARKLYRKWDNVKHIRENIYTSKGRRRKPKKIKMPHALWGISIKTKERLNTADGGNLRFGLVVTLKEVDGKNRIQDFIQQCIGRGWLINRVNVESKLELFNKAEEEIEFD